MKAIATILTGAALAASPVAANAQSAHERGEERLAEMLEGREAGEPQSCITAFRSNALQVIDHVGLVYEAGDTVYVARAENPEALSRHDIVVIDRRGSQLCKQDVIRTIDRYAGYTSGVVFLDDFVPYTKRG